MGCAGSKESKPDGKVKKIGKPKPWKHPQPITKTALVQMRDEFWDTAPHYGGRKGLVGTIDHYMNIYHVLHAHVSEGRTSFSLTLEIWDALRVAAEADLTLAQAIIDSAGVILQSADLAICYDERGAKYELPKYVLSEPTNLIRDT